MTSPDRGSQPSPSERYAAAAQRLAFPLLTAFTAELDFPLDPFQDQACRGVESGRTVLVCAPTGAGKTTVGEFAIQRALARGERCFYTTPIKALSNQKFRDFGRRWGEERVGLLTGDVSVNPAAPVVVMTTEVLRNMLYQDSRALRDLGTVVLDEVHYLADPFRGGVWEEVILQLPDPVQIVGLSATVSNAEEFGDWLTAVRGETDVVVDEIRPVPLWQHMMVGRRRYDLFAQRTDGGAAEPVVDPQLRHAVRTAAARVGDVISSSSAHPRRGRGRHAPRWRPTDRAAVITTLDRDGLLPAIVFIFSRAGCDAAVAQCLRADLWLTNERERAAIDEIVERHTAALPPADLDVLGHDTWREGLRRGMAAHHAGLLPAFKHAVEEAFVEGLVKVVFATETLALGINMPARTVVIERLAKFNGETTVDLTPGEYTQLTGRAGRRGIDVEGHAVVLWSPGVDPGRVAGLATSREYALLSSFRPTYNMAVHLLPRHGQPAARTLLEQSFAQFQTARALVPAARRLAQAERQLATLSADEPCSCGDRAEYGDLVRRLTDAERALSRRRSARRRERARDDLASLRRGDVILLHGGRHAGYAVVLDARPGRDGTIRPLVATEGRWAGRIDATDVRGPLQPVGHLRLGRYTEHWEPKVRRDLASSIRALGLPPAPRRPGRDQAPPDDDEGDLHAKVATLRRAVRSHPVHRCPHRDTHLRALEETGRLHSRITALRDEIGSAQGSLGTQLDRIAALLREWGYLTGDAVTDRGRRLQHIWGEADLALAECLSRGVWAACGPAELVAAVSSLIHPARGERDAPAHRLPGRVREAVETAQRIAGEIRAAERRYGLDLTPPTHAGTAVALAAWADGADLAACLVLAADHGAELSVGDFVRRARQVVDVLRQITGTDVATLVPAADEAAENLRRGVVVLGLP